MSAEDIRFFLLEAKNKILTCQNMVLTEMYEPMGEVSTALVGLEFELREAYEAHIMALQELYPGFDGQIHATKSFVEIQHSVMQRVFTELESAYTCTLQGLGEKVIDAQVLVSKANETLGNLQGLLTLVMNNLDGAQRGPHLRVANTLSLVNEQVLRIREISAQAAYELGEAVGAIDEYLRSI